MAEYKLIYFNGKALGELVRFIFAAANVSYEDYRFEVEDWHKIKPTTPLGISKQSF